MTEVYKNIEKASETNTPGSYTVRVDNDSFNEALSDLPEEILTGKGAPAVVVAFKKGEGVSIIIENIKAEYASLFSIYEEYLRFSGISKVQNPIELAEVIEEDAIRIYREDGSNIILQAWDPEHKDNRETYALFTLDRKKWVIREAVYYLDGSAYVRVSNEYASYGSYYMPSRISLTNLVENTSDVFVFEDYLFK